MVHWLIYDVLIFYDVDNQGNVIIEEFYLNNDMAAETFELLGYSKENSPIEYNYDYNDQMYPVNRFIINSNGEKEIIISYGYKVAD